VLRVNKPAESAFLEKRGEDSLLGAATLIEQSELYVFGRDQNASTCNLPHPHPLPQRRMKDGTGSHVHGLVEQNFTRGGSFGSVTSWEVV
jgi:hypothetical protein